MPTSFSYSLSGNCRSTLVFYLGNLDLSPVKKTLERCMKYEFNVRNSHQFWIAGSPALIA